MLVGPELLSSADLAEYSEDAECTICRSVLFHNRFKCTSFRTSAGLTLQACRVRSLSCVALVS